MEVRKFILGDSKAGPREGSPKDWTALLTP